MKDKRKQKRKSFTALPFLTRKEEQKLRKQELKQKARLAMQANKGENNAETV